MDSSTCPRNNLWTFDTLEENIVNNAIKTENYKRLDTWIKYVSISENKETLKYSDWVKFYNEKKQEDLSSENKFLTPNPSEIVETIIKRNAKLNNNYEEQTLWMDYLNNINNSKIRFEFNNWIHYRNNAPYKASLVKLQENFDDKIE